MALKVFKHMLSSPLALGVPGLGSSKRLSEQFEQFELFSILVS